MSSGKPFNPCPSCATCDRGVIEPFPFTVAFQPIVDVVAGRVFAYEALARGPENEPASFVLNQLDAKNRYAFSQSCRIKEITMAARLGIVERQAKLSLNLLPDTICESSACLQNILNTARSCNFPLENLIFELTEGQRVYDLKRLNSIVKEYRRHGFQMAIDDFGSGYAQLYLLKVFSADMIKLDMALVRSLDQRPAAYTIVRSMVELCVNLNIDVVAEGVETLEEYLALRQCNIKLMQGYLFARPMFEGLPSVTLPNELGAVLA